MEPPDRAPGSSKDVAGAATDADETLLTEMLAMTVRERLQQNDRAIRTIAKLRAGFARREPGSDGGI